MIAWSESPRNPAVAGWRLLSRARAPLSFFDIVHRIRDRTDGPMVEFGHLLDRWVREGLVKSTPQSRHQPEKFVMASDARAFTRPIERPIVKNKHLIRPRERLWRAMRMLKTFDLPTLCMTAEVSTDTARHLLSILARARYVKVRRRTGGLPEYAVLGAWGPRPVEIRRVPDDVEGWVYQIRDHNHGTVSEHRVLKNGGNPRRNKAIRDARARARRFDDGGEG